MGGWVPAISPAAHVWPPRVGNSCRVGLASCDRGQGLRPSPLQWLTGAARQMLPLSTGLSCPGLSLPQEGVQLTAESKPLTFHRRWMYTPASSHPGSTTLTCVHAAPQGPSGCEPQMSTAPCFGLFPSLPHFPPRSRWLLGSLLRRTTCIQVLDSGSAPAGASEYDRGRESVHLVGCRVQQRQAPVAPGTAGVSSALPLPAATLRFKEPQSQTPPTSSASSWTWPLFSKTLTMVLTTLASVCGLHC